ncbi:MAG: PmoA family protein [Labedaea sp.]
MTEPTAPGLRLVEEHQLALRISWQGRELFRYVYRPWDAALESPRPYLHPVRTLGGDLVTIYRPHDHVWHKGIALSLPNVGPDNFWGGATYRRDGGYQQLPNNGTMRHDGFDRLDATDRIIHIEQGLTWVTEQGEAVFTERRRLAVTVDASAGSWTLAFATALHNVSGAEVVIGSPTTEGRPNAGYGGLFWRGPRSFSGGEVYAPGITGGDELMGIRAPWLGFRGRHDDHGRTSTLVFVDAQDNPGHPTQWFVRSGIFACVCPAPFFDEEVPVAPGGRLGYRYAVVIADGDDGDAAAAERLAEAGLDALSEVPVE